MASTRRFVLAGVLVALVALATQVLSGVLTTVFLALTVAVVLAPVQRRLVERGVPAWWASAATTALAFAGALAALFPLVLVLYLRRAQVVAFLDGLPETVTVDAYGYEATVNATDVQDAAVASVQDLAIDLARMAPVLVLKLSLFGLVVFAVLFGRRETRRGLLAPVPPAYRDVAVALYDRIRHTLYAIYVLQVATAAGTVLLALPLFFLLGYQFPVTLAIVAGVLQFLPIVGPSLLVLGMAAYHASVGQAVAAVLVAVLGSVFVAWLPDLLIRPRLARRTARMPGSLYFVGFTGGLLSLGPVGIVAGPLVVGLVAEATSLLAAEVNHVEDLDRHRAPGSDAIADADADVDANAAGDGAATKPDSPDAEAEDGADGNRNRNRNQDRAQNRDRDPVENQRADEDQDADGGPETNGDQDADGDPETDGDRDSPSAGNG